MKITACTISKNEEVDLPGFIEHLIDWVDEIVIVDDRSTDSTKSIAESYGSKVKFVENFMGEDRDFAKQRNISIKNATADWLLHMDVDERVSKELKEEILSSISSNEYDGFKYRRLNFFLNVPMKGGGFQSWNKCQLARNRKHKFKNKIHENCVLEPDSLVKQLDGYMWHLNDSSYEERINKTVKYTKLEAEKLISLNKKITWYHILVRPSKRAFKRFFLQKGFKDGVYGLIWALHCFTAVFKVNVLAWEAQNPKKRKNHTI